MPKKFRKLERAYARLEGWGRPRPHASRRIAARLGCGSTCARVRPRCSSAWGQAPTRGCTEW